MNQYTFDAAIHTISPLVPRGGSSSHLGPHPCTSGAPGVPHAPRDGDRERDGAPARSPALPRVLVYGGHQDFRARAALAFLEVLGDGVLTACGPRGESLGPTHPARLVMDELALDLATTPRGVGADHPDHWDYLVTFRDVDAGRQRAVQPVRWDCADPALYAGTRTHRVEAYRQARDRVRRLAADFVYHLEARADERVWQAFASTLGAARPSSPVAEGTTVVRAGD